MSNTAMTRLTKNLFMIFLDTNKDLTFASNLWKRIGRSTIYSLSAGEQTEDNDYIMYENPVTEVRGNKPTLPQEIVLNEGDPMYDFVAEEFYNLPTGEDCKVPYLNCFGGEDARAWRGIATMTDKVLDTVAGKITFTLNFGDPEKGTYEINDGSPSFVPAETADEDEEEEDTGLM